MVKTLVGKNNYLFLTNDSSRELDIHCKNLFALKILRRIYNFEKFFLIVYPDKSIYYKKYLPNNYNAKYRPGINHYKNYFGNKMLDTYKFLEQEEDCYYKTDTHINLKGNYLVYKEFIKQINDLYNLKIDIINIEIKKIENVSFFDGKYGFGDLLRPENSGDLDLKHITDNFYYSEYLNNYNHLLDLNFKIYDYKLNNITNNFNIINWEIISKNIFYYKDLNLDINYPVFLVFHDSFMVPIYKLIFNSLKNVYCIKSVYDKKFIDLINPDYVFEFRVERFLL